MIFKTVVLTCLLLSSTQLFSSTDEVFRVAPYLLKQPNGHLLLNFQTNQDQTLIIDDNGESKVAFDYKKNEQNKVELSAIACGSVKEIKILNGDSLEVLYKSTQPSAPCDSSASNDPFVFGFISDSQLSLEHHEDVAKIVAYHHSIEPLQFLINSGDIVQTGNVEKEWLDYFLGGKAYLMDIPQIAAVGNHDYRGTKGQVIPKFFQQFLRWEGSDKNGNLFYDFPEVQLLILNSNFSKLENNEEQRTWQWIEEKMQEANKINKPLIVATHFPVFSSSRNRFTSLSVIKLQAKLVPLVEKYKVPLVLGGHTHMYERSFKAGINYLVAGPSGGRPNKPSGKNKYMTFFDKDALTFTKIKMARRVFTIETYNQENKMIDSFIINL